MTLYVLFKGSVLGRLHYLTSHQSLDGAQEHAQTLWSRVWQRAQVDISAGQENPLHPDQVALLTWEDIAGMEWAGYSIPPGRGPSEANFTIVRSELLP